MDRSMWGSGPWDDEPDEAAWADPDTGLHCLARRNTFGAWCGYVGVTQEHPWFEIDYSESFCEHAGCYEHTPYNVIAVHGGLTYSGRSSADEDLWWFGFDTAHLGDLVPRMSHYFSHDMEVYRTLTYVQDQCAILARQLKAIE